MKKRMLNPLFLGVMILISFSVKAQIDVPRPSPFSTVSQVVGFTDVTIEYSRPGVKGRTIFGELVQYDKIWRTGANAATKITFSEDVTIDGNAVPAGSYSIFTKPGTEKWLVAFNSDATASTGQYDATKNVASFSAVPKTLPNTVETLTFSFDNVTDSSTVVTLSWEKTAISFTISTKVDAKVMAQIDKALAGVDPMTYYQAARYYLETGRDLKKAETWMKTAVDGLADSPRFWVLRQYALILAANGKYKEAIEVAQQSIEYAKKNKNDDYVNMNSASINEWKKLVKGKK